MARISSGLHFGTARNSGMVAVFTGNGLGLFNASLTGAGAGAARNGQGTDRQYVNVANGNLVFQSQDEQLLFRGMSIANVRTYNSQGTLAQVGADGWMTGFERRVELLQGTFNQAGSVMRRHTGDGGYQDFIYIAPNTYRANSGDGAHDTLTWAADSTRWTYVEGSTRATETYAAHDDAQQRGRLLTLTDGRANAATWVVDYDSQGRITAVRDTDALAALRYTYDASGRLQQVEVHGEAGGQVTGRVSYSYDTLGRLASALVDLTPGNAADRTAWNEAGGNDGLLYRTSYAYDGDSLRISTVRQSDGTLLSFGYDAQGRVVSATVGDTNANDADGLGQTVTYRYDNASRRTDVSDATGATWSYAFDSEGRLTRVELPARDGLRDVTQYCYDTDGNILQVITLRGSETLRQTDFSYDSQGNALWQWERVGSDGSARAVQRTYTAHNQIATETVFTGLDADGAGNAAAPTGGRTTVYLYDARDRLRFVVSPAGDVRELAYHADGNGAGQIATERSYAESRFDGEITLAALTSWSSTNAASAGSRVDYGYDAWGRASGRTEYAQLDAAGNGIANAAAVTRHNTYDAQGRLLGTLVERGTAGAIVQETVTYTYDGLGRLLSEVSRSGSSVLSSSVWNYLDSGMSVRVTTGMDSGTKRISTELRDTYGRTLSVTTASVDGALSRTSRNYYDSFGRLRASEDASGGRRYYFYDNQGLLQAEVGPTGSAVSYARDAFGNIIATTQHATALDTRTWVQNDAINLTEWSQYVPGAHANDRVLRDEYDTSGMRVRSLDADGNQVLYRYDGAGQLVESVRMDAAGTAATARTTRYFFDANGRQVATLDAGGYLTEMVYDAAGRLIRSVAYANSTSATLRTAGTLGELRPPTDARDQTTRNFYDGLNRLVAVLDAEGYLSEVVYDSTNNARATRGYTRRLDTLTGTETLQTLLASVANGGMRETRVVYDALGRAISELNAEGTVTRYEYDSLGNLVSTTVAAGTTEVREGHLRYDALGNLIGELSGNGATHLLPGMSEAQLDAVYAQYGVRHVYDAVGRRIESIDAQGNRTWYFHDAAGRITHTVRGVNDASGIANGAGEVTESRYDAFGQVIDTITYVGRLTLATPGNRASIVAAIKTLQFVAGTDARVQMVYDKRGLLTSSVDAMGNRRTFVHNAFGEQTFDRVEMGGGLEHVTESRYDARGLRTTLIAGQSALQTSQTWTYDAFGRAISSTDARGQVRQWSYDRNGRQVASWQTVNGVEQRQTQTYDAFDRVLTSTDAEGAVTTYTYDDAARTVSARSPEGITLRTEHNAHGETVSVTDARGAVTRYEYDASGQQTAVVGADGSRQTQAFDTRGLLISSTDANGRRVAYTYDAAGRLLRRTVDPQGLNLTTTYGYDAAGRQLSVVDSRGVETRSRYDANGQLVETLVDPNGLALKTSYTWNAAGQQLSVTVGVGTAQQVTTTYAYDALGRRSSQTVDPGTGRLNLTTQYRYDANGNVVASIDAAGRMTRFAYDADNRLQFTVDAAGGVTRSWYDRNGRVVAQRSYATAINLADLAETATAAQVQARLTANDARDLQQYSVYDQDGQLRLSINGAGAVTGNDRDATGRSVRQIRYANPVNLGTLGAGLLSGATTPAEVLAALSVDPTRDATSWQVLDDMGRVRYEIAADGSVLERHYDASGVQVGTVSYADRIELSAQRRQELAKGSVSVATLAGLLTNNSQNRQQYVVLDAAGRVRFEVRRDADGLGRVIEYGYEGAARVSTTVYGRGVIFDPLQTVASLNALLVPLRNAGEARTDRVMLDAAGRQRFSVDASGAVKETRYDAIGQAVASVNYLIKPDVNSAQTLATLTAWAAAQPADQRRLDSQQYDASGRLAVHTNALGQTERYSYDGAGQLITYTDAANQVWTYAYNAVGKRTSETSPAVAVATVGSNGQFTLVNRAIVTRTEFDALGNVIRRSEDADGGAPRITEYQYDNRGNQVRTTFPDAWVIDEASGQLVASGQRPTIDVSYDTLNRAVVQKDVRGNHTYKVYDVLGQLAYDVDADGYVTSYSYDAYGNQTGLRRFANALQTGAIAGWSTGTALTALQVRDGGGLVASINDRQLLSRYNVLGQKVETLSSQREYYGPDGAARQGTPTVRYQYDGYGNLQRLSELLSGTADQSDAQWAHTWYYYDVLGRNVMTVDAEGYATSTEYTVTGEVATQTEYARALSTAGLGTQRPPAPLSGDAVTGFDRRTAYTYDALGRKITETASRQFQRADGSAGQRDVQTRTGYDVLGRVVTTSDETGTITTGYDALGRVTSVREPERATLRASAESQLQANAAVDVNSAGLFELTSPYTTTVYDAFGNAVQMRRYANGWVNGQTTPVADDARDQLQTLQYDRQGRLVRSVDALGNVRINHYDAADHVIRTRTTLAGSTAERNAIVIGEFAYDRSGRQLSSAITRVVGGVNTVESAETVAYNGFGEIIGKTHYGLAGTLQYGYDAGGNMVSSNEGGADVRLGYNLAGYQVRQSRTSWNGAANVTAVTTIQTDRLGRALRTDLPSFNTNEATVSSLVRQFDRWGNVTQIIDARGYQTNYQYNSFNQITRDERPLVEVVAETGARSWVRPVNEWFYDVFGRLVATRDANGNMRTSEYNNAGQLVKSRDGVGATTLLAYDALGNQRLQQNALGYVTSKDYDRLGRVTAIGDFLLNDAGTARYRTTLQQYRLNENGDRVAVTDALGYTALYDYDSRHLVVRSQTAMGVIQTYGYDVLGRKTLESNALAQAWGTDRDGQQVRRNELTWQYDVFGRTSDHNDLSTRDYNYEYSPGGQLSYEHGNGGGVVDTARSYSYYANGQLKRIEDSAGSYSYYEYDAAGNKTLEETFTRDGAGVVVHTFTRSWYDSHNRVQRVVQDDASAGAARRMFDIRYDYDAVGNRRHVQVQSSYGPNAAAMPVTNTAPTAVKAVADRTVRKGILSEFRVLFSDVFRDAEQDALTLDITLADGSALPSWLGARYEAATGEIIFSAAPPAGSSDADIVVKLTARETANTANQVATLFTVRSRTNSAPRVLADGVAQLNAKTNRPWAVELPASMYFIDEDVGDMLSLSLDNAAALPAWLKLDLSNPYVLRLSGTPLVSENITLILRATDQNGASVVKTIQLHTADNAGPNVVSTPSLGEAIQGRAFSWTQSLSQLFVDPNGDPLQVRASGLPSWLNFTFIDQANPTLRLDGNVPSSVADGTQYAVTLTATDPDGLTSTITLNLVVRANRAPVVLTPNGYQLPSIRVHDYLDVTVAIGSLFTDLEGDKIAFELLRVPSWISATLDRDAGTIRLRGLAKDAGSINIGVKGTDVENLSSSASLLLNIGQDRDPYRDMTVPLNDINLSIGRNFSITLPDNLFVEPDGDGFSMRMAVVTQGGYTLDIIPPVHVDELVSQPWPSWMAFNPTTRTLSGQVPPGTAVSNFTIVVYAVDGRGNVSEPGGKIGPAGNANDSFMRVNLVPFVNTAPVYNADSMPPRTLNHGTPVNFTLPQGAFWEPDGDTLTYAGYVQLPDYWEYVRDPKNPSEYLPDPVLRDGPLVSLSTIGLSIDAATGTITGTPTNLEHLTYRILVMARDPQGAVAQGKFVANVQNAAPIAPGGVSRTALAGSAWSYSLAPFTDANGETLTYTASNLPAWMSFNPVTRTLTGTPSAVGSWTVTITGTDAAGASASTTVTVTTPNSGPVLTNSLPSHETWRNTAWGYQIPANTFVDANGDALTWSISGLPAGINFDPATRYLSGYATTLGAYSVTVSVSDGRGGTNSTSFVINVTNAAPVYNGGLVNRNAQLNEQVNWALPPGTFTDANGDNLTYSIMVEHPGYNETYWEPREAAWMVRYIPPTWQTSYQLKIDPNTGTVTGTMPAFTEPRHPVTGAGGGFLPSFRIKIIASDGIATSEGVFGGYLNFAPVGGQNPRTIKSGVATSIQLDAFSDANGDPLTYSVSGLPAGMWFDAANRTINGSASAGSYAITIYANDGRGGVGTATFTLTVQANNAPTAPNIGTMNMQVGTGVGVVLPAFTDPDYDPVTYSISTLPPGLWFDANSRTLGGTPSQPGNYWVQMNGYDNRGGVGSAVFLITVAPAPIPNRAPYVAVAPPTNAGHFQATNQYYVQPSGFTLSPNTFADPDNNPLTYSIITKPAWLSYEYTANGHSFWGKSNDTRSWAIWTITIRATDPSGLYADVSFTVTSEYWGSTPGGGGTVPRRVAASVLASDSAMTTSSTGFGQPGTGPAPGDPIDHIDFEDIPETPQEQAARPVGTTPSPVPQGSSAQTPAAPTVTAWAGPVQIAGGSAPSGLGNVSSATGTGAVAVETKDYWYTYDAENRILVNNGSLQNGQVVITGFGEDSYALAYDAAGNVVSRRTNRSSNGVEFYWIDRTAYDLRGNRLYEYFTDTLSNGLFKSGGGVQKKLVYDAANHLTATYNYYESGSVWEDKTGPGEYEEIWGIYSYGGWLYSAETYSYDKDGRVIVQQSFLRDTSTFTWLRNADNTNGRQTYDISLLNFQNGTDYTNGYDAAGRLVSYKYQTSQYIHTYSTQYEGRETWLQKSVTGTSTNSNYKTTTNTLTYDAFGKLMSQRETTPLQTGSIDDRMRYYASDLDGKVVNRREGTLNSNGAFTQDGSRGQGGYRLVHANGQQIAELKEGYQGMFAGRAYTTAQIQSVAGRGAYDAGGGQVIAQAGENLRSIAKRVYGTDQMWYVLADANGFGDPDAELAAGTRLVTPAASVNRNDAGIFKPYDPSSAIGSTTPGLPYIPPPPPQKCGALSKVISIVVQVVVTAVVTYYTGNAQAGAAAGAAAGNHAGQVSSAMLNGQYDWKRWASMTANPFQGNSNDLATTAFDPIGHGMPGGIDYKSIGISAGAAATASYAGAVVGEATNVYVGAATQAATSYAANYQYSKASGYDASWSNRSLLQNVGTALISTNVNESGLFNSEARIQPDGSTANVASSTGSAPFSWTSIARNTAINFSSGATTYALGKVLGTSEHWNTGDQLADAFGNALGSELAAPYRDVKLQGLERANSGLGQINAELAAAGHASWSYIVDGVGYGASEARDASIQSYTSSAPAFKISDPTTAAASAITRASYSGSRIVNLDTVYAVVDQFAPSGWYFYSRNTATRSWIDAQRSILNPAITYPTIPNVMNWSRPPSEVRSGVAEFIGDVQKRIDGQRKPLTFAERFSLSEKVAQSKIDPATGAPWRTVQAWDPDAPKSEAALKAERELKGRQNGEALNRRVGNLLAFFGPTAPNGTYNGQLVNPITDERVSNSDREAAIGDVLTASTFLIGPRAITRGPSNPIDDLSFASGGAGAVDAPLTTTVYRVEGSIHPNHRILIDEAGGVSLVPNNDKVIWLNFGQEARAQEYLQRKISDGLPGADLKTFEVDTRLLLKIRDEAVPERLARLNPTKPIVSRDPAPDQFGIPKSYFEEMLRSIKQGTGKNGQ
ncbi:putative Ig domain-containing protein [Stenotrophomonas maltophilia]|nr:putative Ig domain-containing protein [Stenotrophomonas maltophilia]